MEKVSYTSLKYLFFTFLKIGSYSFGGFMALISVVQKQIVEKDKRIDNESILEGISLASILPGPVAVNVVAFIGYKLKGINGALVSIAGILLPSFLLMLLLSHLYLKYVDIPAINGFFLAVLPVVAAIIISVAFDMTKKNIKDIPQAIILLISAIGIWFFKSYFSTLLLILSGGIIAYFIYRKSNTTEKQEIKALKFSIKSLLIPIILGLTFLLIVFSSFILPSNYVELAKLQRKIMLTFSGMSLSMFGGGYVFIPTMQKVIVGTLQWLTNKEFTDAIAMGQITPGPILVSATFIGFKVSGFWGALNATLSIFLPPAFLMILCSHFMQQLKKSVVLISALKGIKAVVIGMIFTSAVIILANKDFSVTTAVFFIVALFLLFKFKLNPVYLIPPAGILGLFIF